MLHIYVIISFQHYAKLHAEKKYVCRKCDKGFGLERDCLRHQEDCGLVFSCLDCDKTYPSRVTRNNHCQINGHRRNDDTPVR